MNQINPNQETDQIQNPVQKKESIYDSAKIIVDIMNSGKGIKSEDVYPPGRYQGD